MTETTVNRVAELYKEKSELLGELSTLTNIEEYKFTVGYDTIHRISPYGSVDFKTISQSFLAEIKKLTEEHIKQRISKIDDELKEL